MVHQPAPDREPLVAARAAYREGGGTGAPGAAHEPWWKTFQDPQLDALIREGLASNLELRALAARIEQADALVRRAGARLFPALDAGGEYDWQYDSSRDRDEEASSLGLDLSWEIDVWGRLRSARRAASLDAAAARWDRVGGRLLLSAAVAETYFEILEQRQQLDLLSRQEEVNETLLELTRLRFGQGQSSIVDVLQQREQLASTRARVPAVQAELDALEYSLDVLLGRPPGERTRLSSRTIPPPPDLPAVGIPADLLLNRPDLLAARDRVHALDYRVGEALADRLPRLRVGGAVAGVGRPGIDSLITSAFASAVGPLYDGGLRDAEIDRRRARLEEALADYSEAFLVAAGEVETALVRERKQAEQVTRLETQLAIAEQLLTETRNRYSQGLTDYLPVLAALVRVQELERDVITSRRRHLSLRVVLHRALGGPLPLEPGDRMVTSFHES
jgi:NodT family efflux transporter outer membrane factor (OMF) lipoprotein